MKPLRLLGYSLLALAAGVVWLLAAGLKKVTNWLTEVSK